MKVEICWRGVQQKHQIVDPVTGLSGQSWELRYQVEHLTEIEDGQLVERASTPPSHLMSRVST